MPERVAEKRKAEKKRISVDWLAVIVAIVALIAVKIGLVGKIPW
jgi:hypothetical protein